MAEGPTSLTDDLRELADHSPLYGQETHGELHADVLATLGPLLEAHRAFPGPSFPGNVTMTAKGQHGAEDVAGTMKLYDAARAVALALTEKRS